MQQLPRHSMRSIILQQEGIATYALSGSGRGRLRLQGRYYATLFSIMVTLYCVPHLLSWDGIAGQAQVAGVSVGSIQGCGGRNGCLCCSACGPREGCNIHSCMPNRHISYISKTSYHAAAAAAADGCGRGVGCLCCSADGLWE